MLKTIHNLTDSTLEIFGYLLGLIVLAGTAFAYIEGETILRSLYWATITATSVGYGDVTPKTDAGMILAMATAVLGLVVMALFIAKCHSVLIRNDHEFTHDEQEKILKTLEEVKEKLK
jgi:voltage-gated potassium channel